MITDTLKNFSIYTNLHKDFEKAFEFLKSCDSKTIIEGRHPIDNDRVYANVEKYSTSADNKKLWEAHRKYIDIQYLLYGKECIGWTNISNMPDKPIYDSEKDCILCSETLESSFLHMQEGQFAIFFPEDVHKPKCLLGQGQEVIKVVVKIPVE